MMNPIKKKKNLIFTFFNLKQQFLLDSIVIKYLHNNPISIKCCVMLQKTQMCAYLTRGK